MHNELNDKHILITGASGLIGSALHPRLEQQGYRVHVLSRRDSKAPFYYDQDTGRMHLAQDIPLTGVVNLAGASLADGRWSKRRKQLIMDSRVLTTEHLCEALAALPTPPEVLISASAIGYYGDTGSDQVDEDSGAGKTFLADVSIGWEQATEAAKAAGIRVVLPRFGLVLSPEGGVLPNFILPGRLAAVGRVGSGRQFISWISLDDCVAVLCRFLETPAISGAVNVVSNHAVTNAEFTRAVATALHRPRLPPLPAFAVRLLFGQMGEEALLASSRVHSQRLPELGIELQYPQLDKALAYLL